MKKKRKRPVYIRKNLIYRLGILFIIFILFMVILFSWFHKPKTIQNDGKNSDGDSNNFNFSGNNSNKINFCEDSIYKSRNYYENYKSPYPGIDSLFMLELISKKEKNFSGVQTLKLLNKDYYKKNPFIRLFNKSIIFKDLILERNVFDVSDFLSKNLKNSYNNSIYNINKKYSGYYEDPSDDILIKSLYCDIIGYEKIDFDLLSLLPSLDGSYTDTHVLLALLFLKENKCYDKNIIDENILKLSKTIAQAQDKDNIFSDLYAERVVVLFWSGYGNYVKEYWIIKITNNQNLDFGWGDDTNVSNLHTTGSSILSLIYYGEGKDKQKFYPIFDG